MARKKLPEDQVMTTMGIKLPGTTIEEIEELAKKWGVHPSAAGREFLLLGLAVYKATQQSRIFTELIWQGSLSKDELRAQFSRILGEPGDIGKEEGSKVPAKAKEEEVEETKRNQPTITIQGFNSLDQVFDVLKQIEAGTLRLEPLTASSDEANREDQDVVLESLPINPDDNADDTFQSNPVLPAGRAQIIFGPTTPLKG